MSNYEILTYILVALLIYIGLQIVVTATVIYEFWKRKMPTKFVGVKLDKVTKDALGDLK